jgi:hypothetical protein
MIANVPDAFENRREVHQIPRPKRRCGGGMRLVEVHSTDEDG